MSYEHLGGVDVPVVTANTVILGTGAAGFAAADRLWEFGQRDLVMVTDKVGAGTSRNAGSDKQTYYKLTLSGEEPDSVREMAQTLFDGQAMDGDIALAEASLSAQAFLRLCELGVPFPQNRYGEFIGYKTDHDPRRRATSVGPYTSRTMVERIEAKVAANGTPIHESRRIIDLIVSDGEVVGVLCLRLEELSPGECPFILYRCRNVVYATGGPAGMYGTRVYPNGQWGASGAALRAGASGKNLTEWQFGLASIHPRWNVSGTYMQALPRFVSTDDDGGDEREFLAEFLPDYGEQLTAIFLKGYQWPFDVRKAGDGSSIIDLLVYRETVLRGRRVFLDFTRNPMRAELDATALAPEARDYLDAAGVLFGTPIERLRHMNLPAYEFYLNKNPYVDLATDRLEVAVCAQHNNGGLAGDAWWQSDLHGLFPVGEAAGAHGVYRPGGAALNSGQVGALRAARFISARRGQDPIGVEEFSRAAASIVGEAVSLFDGATRAFSEGVADSTAEMLRAAGDRMSTYAGPVRSVDGIAQVLQLTRETLGSYASAVSADPGNRQSLSRLFLVRDILLSQYVYLCSMADYVEHGGRSRGAVLYTDVEGELPGARSVDGSTLPELFRYSLDDGALAEQIQEVRWMRGDPSDVVGECVFTWRKRRPIPEADEFFENVWRDFRETGNVW